MSSSGGDQSSSSASAFLSTLIPVGLLAAAFVGVFLTVRTKYKRVYGPRTYHETLSKWEMTRDLPTGRFNWLKPFSHMPDEDVLKHQSLDGYLYLRFLKMLILICFVGSCITFPVLFPVNATAGGGQKQFDMLSFSNIGKNAKNRYYAHVFIGWIFFAFVMYMITRETMYCINIRNAYLRAPFYASRISSRTVLFTDVPAEYLNPDKLRTLFSTYMQRYWLATDCKDLEKKVEERDKDAMMLENAEIQLCSKGNKRHLKWEKKGDKRKDAISEYDPEAPATSRYLKKKDRPTHRLGKIPLIGKKVDTIDWTRSELRRLNPEVQWAQDRHRSGDAKLLPAVFIEFTTQEAAEAAFRRMTPSKPPHMRPRAIGERPDEIIWKNLGLSRKQRWLRRFGTNTFLTLMIIFWAIPVAVVGAISNINYLTNKVPFLGFINHIPPVVLGVVTGLLPSVALSILMSLVPVFCRFAAKLSGEVTLPAAELRTQSWYMAFQVVQVFLVMTLASGASSVVTKIINEPSSATTLLAENLPKASNFYISYFIVQGLGISTGSLLNIGGLAMGIIGPKFLQNTPRKKFNSYITLGGQIWGAQYPQFGNLGIIALSYSIISPLLLGFATVGFLCIYLAVRYNSFYVLSNTIDTKGLGYARVLQQLTTGVYIGQVCQLGLFAINTAPGPIVLQAICLGVTAIYHAIMRHTLSEYVLYPPDSMDYDERLAMLASKKRMSYDSTKEGRPPSEKGATGPISKLSEKKATFLARWFDPRRSKSYDRFRNFVFEQEPPQYSMEEEESAYFNPAISSPPPTLWIVRDDLGISTQEVKDSIEVISITDEFARFEGKKVVWERGERVDLNEVPIWKKDVEY
ncbi:DUF221-domain-containing protein [Venustampulla echinocandica]|uniref:DUF221-domain-containing protein n=1 Tax=Venustampulla echinocandica TaxID=2656787 RepID=A0A370TR35_9HELO|nr:DUF221-domain-containing protein [Venustampulla echinocandica]RDL37974.1 DUF221-domain-containing protein [Venustampulla echinocandica]